MPLARRRAELQRRSEQLRLRSAELRVTIARDAQVLGPPLAAADQIHAGLGWLREHPEWPLGGALLLALLRPRRALRWAGRLWWGWRQWQRARRLLRAFGPR